MPSIAKLAPSLADSISEILGACGLVPGGVQITRMSPDTWKVFVLRANCHGYVDCKTPGEWVWSFSTDQKMGAIRPLKETIWISEVTFGSRNRAIKALRDQMESWYR